MYTVVGENESVTFGPYWVRQFRQSFVFLFSFLFPFFLCLLLYFLTVCERLKQSELS